MNLLRVQSERRVQRVNLHLALGGDFSAESLTIVQNRGQANAINQVVTALDAGLRAGSRSRSSIYRESSAPVYSWLRRSRSSRSRN